MTLPITNFPTTVTSTCDGLLGDRNQFIVLAKCTGTPPATANVFAHGCLMLQTDSGTGNRALYQNTGSSASPVWDLLDVSGVIPSDTLALNTVSTAGAATYTAAQMVEAIMNRDGGATNRIDVTDTAAALVAIVPGAIVGSVFYFYLNNTSATAGQKISVTGGTGVTISGTASVFQTGSQIFIGRFTNVSAGTEAVTLFALDDIDSLMPVTDTAATSVNTIGLTTAATATDPIHSALGTDANIGITLSGKGTGVVGVSTLGGLGYKTGAGSTVTQATNRTTGVTINAPTGAITLVSAAGSATPATFVVTNSAVVATDVILLNQKSGTDKYEIFVTAVGAGGFSITSFTTGGTTTEQPVFNFAVIKGVTA